MSQTASLFKMHISPNPTSQTLNIHIESQDNEAMLLQVYNQHGQQVYSQIIAAFSGSKHIQITNKLRISGVYTLRLTTKKIKQSLSS